MSRHDEVSADETQNGNGQEIVVVALGDDRWMYDEVVV